MGFLGSLKSIGSRVIGGVQKVARVVGNVAETVNNSPIAQTILTAGSRLPVVGSFIGGVQSALPMVERGAKFVDASIGFGKDAYTAVQNKDISQAGSLINQGQNLFSMGKGLRKP